MLKYFGVKSAANSFFKKLKLGQDLTLFWRFAFKGKLLQCSLSLAINSNLTPTVIANLRLETEARSEIGKSCKFYKSDPDRVYHLIKGGESAPS